MPWRYPRAVPAVTAPAPRNSSVSRDECEEGAADRNQDESTETQDGAPLGGQWEQSRHEDGSPDHKEEFAQDFHHHRNSNASIINPFVFTSVSGQGALTLSSMDHGRFFEQGASAD